MSAQPPVALPPPPPPGRAVRVEYLDFRNGPEHREYRLAVYGPDGPAEFRFRIAIEAFGAGRVRLQDGPDVCYQMLLRAVAAGEKASPDVVTIDDLELGSYRAAHTLVPKRRSYTPSSPPPQPFVPRIQPSPRSPRRAVAVTATNDSGPAFEAGQRVSHSVFGAGVTTSSGGGHTVIRFDEDGPKTFITSMLKLEVLSGPRTWETGPRGKNRPCEVGSARRHQDEELSREHIRDDGREGGADEPHGVVMVPIPEAEDPMSGPSGS